MNPSWKNEPTAAARVIRRAMQERGWTQQDVALEAGIDAPTVSRWARGVVNPSDHRVAEVAAMLGYDPREFGITGPRALAAAEQRATQPLEANERPPAWYVNAQITVDAKLDAILANQERILLILERTAR